MLQHFNLSCSERPQSDHLSFSGGMSCHIPWLQLPIDDVVVDHGIELLSYGNAGVGRGWGISDTLHILMCMAAVWLQTLRITSVSISPLSLCSQTCSVSFNRAVIILFVPIDLNIINTPLIRLWVRKCSRVIVMKIWGVYSDWVCTETSFMPYHRFPSNPFFDWLLVHFLLPLLFPFRETFK